MTSADMTIEDVREAGMSALFDALGPANAIRFLQLFQPGAGDYTRDRHAWLDDLNLDDLMADVKKIQDPGAATATKGQPESTGHVR